MLALDLGASETVYFSNGSPRWFHAEKRQVRESRTKKALTKKALTKEGREVLTSSHHDDVEPQDAVHEEEDRRQGRPAVTPRRELEPDRCPEDDQNDRVVRSFSRGEAKSTIAVKLLLL